MIEGELEGFGFAGGEGLFGATAYFGFEATATEGADHGVIGKEKGLGAFFLRGGTFDARDDAERETFVLLRRFDHLLIEPHRGNNTASGRGFKVLA